MRADVYQKVTDRIVTELERGVRPWMKPWSAGNGEGRIMRPLRANGIPYQGINVLMLWSESIDKGFISPIWMTFKQALALNANVRKGEHGSLVVYAGKITRTETDIATGEEAEHEIPFMKGYTRHEGRQLPFTNRHHRSKDRECPRQRTQALGFIYCAVATS